MYRRRANRNRNQNDKRGAIQVVGGMVIDVNFVFIGLAIFVVLTLVNAFLPRTALPREGRLRDKLSPQLRNFIASLPLPDDHALASYCAPWKPTEPRGYPKEYLPLWQDSEGRPSYYSTYIKLGSKPRFHGVTESENEQAFLGCLVVTVMQRLFKTERPRAIELGRSAADAVGFRYFDEATKFLSTWKPQPPKKDEQEPEEVEEDAPYRFADLVNELEKQRG